MSSEGAGLGRAIAIACVILLTIACFVRAAEPPLIAKAGRGASIVKVVEEKGMVVIDVASAGGIGQIAVQSGGQPWPMAAKLRLRYDEKRPFTHLEGVTLTDSKSQLHTFLGDTEVEISYRDGAARSVAAKPDLKVGKGSGTIEVTLPLAWLADEQEFVVHWVDFYRG